MTQLYYREHSETRDTNCMQKSSHWQEDLMAPTEDAVTNDGEEACLFESLIKVASKLWRCNPVTRSQRRELIRIYLERYDSGGFFKVICAAGIPMEVL